MKRLFFILVIFFLHQCALNENKNSAEKNLISTYKGYSFDDYVELLQEENKSRNFQDIDGINE